LTHWRFCWSVCFSFEQESLSSPFPRSSFPLWIFQDRRKSKKRNLFLFLLRHQKLLGNYFHFHPRKEDTEPSLLWSYLPQIHSHFGQDSNCFFCFFLRSLVDPSFSYSSFPVLLFLVFWISLSPIFSSFEKLIPSLWNQ